MSIEQICNKYGIVNYTINDDLVDVDGSVNLYNKGLTELPLRFGQVSGNFYCDNNKLTSLDGCPDSVSGNFNCYKNQLTSLEGGPNSVGGNFYCSFNKLTDLEGSPDSIGGNFTCVDNQLTDLKGFNTNFKGMFNCKDNPIGSIFNKVEQDFTNWFKQLKIGENNQVNLNRLKYLQTIFDFDINIELINEYYLID